MITNNVASNVLGTIGTVLWCIQLIPQIIHNYRKKNCEGLPPLMLFLWAACGIPFGIYFISTNASIPVQIQPEIFFLFCSISWVQSLYYPPVQYSKTKILVLVVLLWTVAVGLQAGMITYFKRQNYPKENWRLLIFGILASIMLAAGLVPPYFELAKRKGRVVGINFVFLAIDCSGAIFSMLSVVFGNMDIMGMVLYAICAVLEIGIFTSHIIWGLRFNWGKDLGENKEVEEEEEEEEEEDDDDDDDSENNQVSVLPPDRVKENETV